MNCPSCGQLIPTGDKHCVYCGASTGWLPLRLFRRLGEKLPIWAKMLGTVAFLGVVATTAILVGNSDNTVSNGDQNASPNATRNWENVEWIIKAESSTDTPVPAPVITSKYISGTEPIIDGVMSHDEWGQPAFTKTFQYTLEGSDGTGSMEGYFMNDSDDLYAAIELKAEDFDERLIESLGIAFDVYIYFDGDNDGIMRLGEDVKRIWSGLDYQYSHIDHYYDDCNFCTTDGLMACRDNSASQNGEGATAYSEETSGYTFEFRIPLNSGDPQDLAVESGNTIGVQVLLQERHEPEGSYTYGSMIGWPTSEGYPLAETYAKLILSSGG